MSRYKLSIFTLAVVVLLWSALAPHDRFTWVLETLPAWLGLPLLFYFERKTSVTPLLFTLVCLHAMLLCIGGKYTYAQVPFGFWLQDTFHLARNPYDRIGHFFQGLEPVILAREVLLRKKVLARGFWLGLYCVSVCLAFSAFYELIEWFTALATGEGAEAFLGTQGDVWDTQWDMFMALCGAVAGLGALSSLHDHELKP